MEQTVSASGEHCSVTPGACSTDVDCRPPQARGSVSARLCCARAPAGGSALVSSCPQLLCQGDASCYFSHRGDVLLHCLGHTQDRRRSFSPCPSPPRGSKQSILLAQRSFPLYLGTASCTKVFLLALSGGDSADIGQCVVTQCSLGDESFLSTD